MFQIEEDEDAGPLVPSDVLAASCSLICEWAEKLLGRHFNHIHEVAKHLLDDEIVPTHSRAAFTVLAGTASVDGGPWSP